MGKLTRWRYAHLDEIVESRGMDWMYDILMDRLSAGDNPQDIAREEFDLPWYIVRQWIEKNCPDAVALAGRARADSLEWNASEIVANATPDTVSLAKLQSDHMMKIAGKLDRAKWGEVKDKVVLNTVNGIDSALGGFALALLDKMRGRVDQQQTIVEVVDYETVNSGGIERDSDE